MGACVCIYWCGVLGGMVWGVAFIHVKHIVLPFIRIWRKKKRRKLEVKRKASHEKIITAFGFAYKDTVFTNLYS